jgi:hypothetical protein
MNFHGESQLRNYVGNADIEKEIDKPRLGLLEGVNLVRRFHLASLAL